mmetsp:Transcript_27115/g.74557  ORF Transcript_27115/g.74557 Transcript_27115/m.74557 type:complete len:223 (-) Transcript_27115:253-921(-)
MAIRGTKRATLNGTTTTSCSTDTIAERIHPSRSSSETTARKIRVKNTQKAQYVLPRTQMILSRMRQILSCRVHSGQPSYSNFLKLRLCSAAKSMPGIVPRTMAPTPTPRILPILSPTSSEEQAVMWARLFFVLMVPEASKKRQSNIKAPQMSVMKKRVRSADGEQLQCTRAAPMGFCTRRMRTIRQGSEAQWVERVMCSSSLSVTDAWTLYQLSSRWTERVE